jgi:DNA polymerase III delta subunit
MSKSVLVAGSSFFLKQRFLNHEEALAGQPFLKVEWQKDLKDFILNIKMRPLIPLGTRYFLLEKVDSKANKELAALIGHLPDDVVLYIRTLDRKSPPKWLRDLTWDQQVIKSSPDKWKLGEWVQNEASSLGLDLSQAFADALVMNVGEDLASLCNEIEKLHIYCDGRTKVTVDDIQAVLYQHEAFSIFEVADLWCHRDMEQALIYFHQHLEHTPDSKQVGSALILCNTLQDKLDRLIRAKGFKTSGMSDQIIAEKLGTNPYVFKKGLAPYLTVRSMDDLEKAYDALAHLELKIKMGGPLKLYLENFLVNH